MRSCVKKKRRREFAGMQSEKEEKGGIVGLESLVQQFFSLLQFFVCRTRDAGREQEAE